MTARQEPLQRHVLGWHEFWEGLRQSKHRFLGLDYDGTLAPFHVERMKALPLEGVVPLLKDIANSPDTTLTIVTGRPVEELLALVGDLGVTVVGSHGWEIRSPDGALRTFSPDPFQQQALIVAKTLLSERGMGKFIEDKNSSVAFHIRPFPQNVEENVENAVKSLWKPFADEFGLECRIFNGGVELRCPGRDKGTALREIAAGLPAKDFSVYVGDDQTDEDAFQFIQKTGIGVKVGMPDKATAAKGYLKDCGEVLKFLQTWKSKCHESEA